MMAPILAPIFLILFCSWMLWGWVVGETKNIKWMRVWFAPAFVISAMLISAGAGAMATKIFLKRQIRHDVTEVLNAIENRVAEGDSKKVLSEIRATDYTGSPDASDFDLLKHLPTMVENLSPSTDKVAARKPAELH